MTFFFFFETGKCFRWSKERCYRLHLTSGFGEDVCPNCEPTAMRQGKRHDLTLLFLAMPAVLEYCVTTFTIHDCATVSLQLFCGVPPNVPNYTVRGSNFSEQLQDIYAHNVVFNLHIDKVKEYQIADWGNPINVAEPLNQVKWSLFSQTNMLVLLAQRIDPEVALTTVEPPHQSHNHSWAKKSYGWKVIVGLKDWLAEVNKVLKAAQEPCDNHIDEASGGSRTLGARPQNPTQGGNWI
uniref:Uncharacterized protein n=1 Tax=Hippocampus comes TaxID=109280 RepID=A0A3Q2YGV3_HIPCM